jgi:acetyltransferase-like isoleucine patch superfamily enzyme
MGDTTVSDPARNPESRKWRWFSKLPWYLWGPVMKSHTSGWTARRDFRRQKVGESSYVDSSVQIFGWRNVSIGHHSTLSEDAWLNTNMRAGSGDRIVIGNNCHIGRRNYFSSGPLIHVKDYGFTGLDCRLLGCGHEFSDPFMPFVAAPLTPGAPIVLGVNCWLATAVTVLEGVHIGHGSVIGACSLVRNDIPPFSLAVGAPAKVVRRFNMFARTWVDIDGWNDELEAALPGEGEYLKLLQDTRGDLLPSIHAASSVFGWLS